MIRKPLSRQAFTLMEMLVVIFVLAVMFALLFPAVQSALRALRARTTHAG